MGRGLSRKRFVPDFPGSRGVPSLENEVTELAEFQEWNLRIGGSFPEFLVYRELERRGFEPGTDFVFQSAQFGGRNRLGGAVVDFILQGTIAGRVQGEFFHFRNTELRAANVVQRRLLEAAGFIVVDMLATEIEKSPSRVVFLFIQGRETPEAISRKG